MKGLMKLGAVPWENFENLVEVWFYLSRRVTDNSIGSMPLNKIVSSP